MIKNIQYFLEAVVLYAVFFILKALPARTASNCGAWLGRHVGVRLGASKKALKNLSRVFPEQSSEEHHAILVKMWDHMGRVFAEYAHIRYIAEHRTTIDQPELLEAHRNSDKGAMFISGHIGNWELGCAATYLQTGIKIGSAYRPLNNTYADSLLVKARTLNHFLPSFAKSRIGGRAMMKHAKAGGNIVFLIDQKYNEGIETPFFGHAAMTNPAFVDIARKFNLDLVPVRLLREDDFRFKLKIFPAISLTDKNGETRDTLDVISEAHRLLESWIVETPEQWLWLHRRWKD